MTEDQALRLSSGQARRVGELLVGLERLALEMGWRWDGERWVKPGEGGGEQRSRGAEEQG